MCLYWGGEALSEESAGEQKALGCTTRKAGLVCSTKRQFFKKNRGKTAKRQHGNSQAEEAGRRRPETRGWWARGQQVGGGGLKARKNEDGASFLNSEVPLEVFCQEGICTLRAAKKEGSWEPEELSFSSWGGRKLRSIGNRNSYRPQWLANGRKKREESEAPSSPSTARTGLFQKMSRRLQKRKKGRKNRGGRGTISSDTAPATTKRKRRIKGASRKEAGGQL